MNENNKRSDKEKKGVGAGAGIGGGSGSAPQWIAGAAKVGAGSSSTSGFLGGASGKAALLLKMKSILASKALLLATVTTGMVVGGNGLSDIQKRGFGVEVVKDSPASTFDRREGRSAASTADLPGAGPEEKSALELAAEANEGSYGDSPAASVETPEKESASADAPEVGAGSGGADANAMVESMLGGITENSGAKAKEGLASKFGKMSSSMGTGASKAQLSGGAGLAGGIGGNFKKGLTNQRLSAMGGGSKSKGSRTMQATGTGGQPRGTKGSHQRLARMSHAMRSAEGSEDTDQADVHNRQWAGEGARGGGSTADVDGKAPPISSDEGSDGGSPYGNSLNNKTLDSGAGYDDGFGDDFGSKKIKNPVNITPYQQMVDMAQVLLQVASMLLLAATIFGLLAKAAASSVIGNLGLSEALYGFAKYLAYAAAAVAAILTLLGVGIMAQGQTTQGGIFTAIGALLTGFAWVAAEGYGEAADAAGAAQETAKEAGVKATEELTKKGAEEAGKEVGKHAAKEAAKEGAKVGAKEAAKQASTAFANNIGTAQSLASQGISGAGSAVGGISSPIMDNNAEGWEGDYKESSGYNEAQKEIDDYEAENERIRQEMRDLDNV